MNKERIRLLVVDDERGLCAGVAETLRREGYQVDAATEAAAARELIERHLYNLVLTDKRMPGASGMDLLREVKAKNPDTVCILITAFGTVENAVEAMKLGAFDYLSKPIELPRLREIVRQGLLFQKEMAADPELRARFEQRSDPSMLVGKSEQIRSVVRLIHEVAPADVTVLIEGESGTGKEIAARLVHAESRRKDKPFISINCAALPEQLVESELFGHTRGAFTGAVSARSGGFQLADGGTLFLDEIGDLSLKGQGDLLRVLEEGAFRVVGGTELIHVDVRVVAATNKRLEAAIAAGRFREDLYYRLHIVPLLMPPLRDRPEDVPLLIDIFLDQFAAKHKRPRKRLVSDALPLFERFSWPGNVRQLRNTVERLVITSKGDVIGRDDLPEFLRAETRIEKTFTVRAGASLAEVEKELIRRTLQHVTSRREEAAKVLGISRRALQYKLKEYGLLEQDE